MPAQVLVVDQNPVIQATIENTLSPQNCEVTSVRDALSGLDLAYKIKPDVMIADLRMEGLMVYSFCAGQAEVVSFPNPHLSPCAAK